MKIKSVTPCLEGFSLTLVLVFTGVLFLLLSGVLALTTTNATLTQRYNEYYDSVAAAEAATEKVVASMASDFQNSGVNGVDGNLANYGASIPTPAEVNDWANYQFSDPSGGPSATYVTKLTAWQFTDLNWKYTGFKGSNSTYRIISNARNTASAYGITSAVKQEIQLVSIPLFEFEVFYALDMEICPGAGGLTFNGRVHDNATIYCQPSSPNTVTFLDHVTAAQKILPTNSPNDSNVRTLGTIVYQAEHDWNVSSLNLPLGISNNPTNLHALIDIPPGSESANSLLGVQRFYNKADLIILVSNATVIATSGAYNNFSTTVCPPWSSISSFVQTNITSFDKREGKSIQATQIDLQNFNSAYSGFTTQLGRPVKILYVADLRSTDSTTLSGVKLVNGQTLPANGLTIATYNPLYVKGHYNAPAGALGTANTTGTAPAALIADAVTVLSGLWNDGDGSKSLNAPARNATDTTINAAVLGGIVPSAYGNYSGGVENFLRLLEDWTSRTLTFNGSMVALFPSKTATAYWGNNSDISRPPQRAYAFDLNFKDNAKLPPGTPEVRTIIHAAWNITQANSTQ